MQLCCTIRRVQLFTLLVAASTIISILIILFFFNYPHFAKLRTIDAVVYRNGTEAMDRFITTKELKNLRLSFYVFNVTNVQDVIKSGAKVNLQEIGPFVYHELKTRELIDNNQTSGLITYRQKTRYNLDLNSSVANPKTTFISWPNVPLIVARDYLDKMSSIEKFAAYLVLNRAIKSFNEGPFMTDSVENFLFNGSKRAFFEYLQNLDKFKFIKPWPLKDNKFGLLYGKNDTIDPAVDHKLTSSAGFGLNQTYRDVNKYALFDGSETLPYWQSTPPNCNQLGGTDGRAFSPFLNRNEILEVFSLDLCRKLQFKFRQNATFLNVPSLRYTLDERSFTAPSKSQSNSCYCLSKSYNDVECRIDGLIDLSKCVQPKIVGSGAHFFAGSPDLVTKLSGLTPPNASLHEPIIYVEPNTGLAVKVNAPMQFNIKLETGGFEIFKFYKDPEPLIIPLLWVAESAELTDDQASLLKKELLLLDSWFVSMVLGGAIMFIIFIMIIATILCFRYRNSRAIDPSETEPLLSNNVQVQSISTEEEQQQHP